MNEHALASRLSYFLWSTLPDEQLLQLSDKGKLAFFFLLTHPHQTALGALRQTLPGLACELGWKPKAFRP